MTAPPSDERPETHGNDAPMVDNAMIVVEGRVQEVSFDATLTRAWHHRDEQSNQMRDDLNAAMRSLSNSAADTGSRARSVRKEGMPMLQEVHAKCSDLQEQTQGRINQIRRETSRLERAVEGARAGAVRRARMAYWGLWLKLNLLWVFIGLVIIVLLAGGTIWLSMTP